MLPTLKRIRASKWQTDLLNTLYAKSTQPSHAQIDQISDETGLEETWIKHWFQKRIASSKKSLPAVSGILSTERKSITRSSSVPISTPVPRATVQPGDLYVHDPAFHWEEPPVSHSDDNAVFVSDYDTQDRGQISQPFQLHTSPILFETPSASLHSHAQSQDQDQAPVQSYSNLKPNYVFTTPLQPLHLQPQHYPNQAQASQKSRTMSPSLGYIPSTFPMSIFTDSPTKQLRNIMPRIGADSDQNTITPLPVPTVQDPYSIRFPLTFSPRRRHGPSPSFFDPLHQESQLQPQAAYNFNYGYDIPSELSFSASFQAQSTSVHSPSQAPLLPIAGSGRYPSHVQHQQIPIAYTARLTDLTAFALNMKKSADASAPGDDMPISDSSVDNTSSKSGDMDEKPIYGIITNKETNKENEQLTNNQNATQNEEHPDEPIVCITSAKEEDTKDSQGLSECNEKQSDNVPRRLLRSASAQARLAELES